MPNMKAAINTHTHPHQFKNKNLTTCQHKINATAGERKNARFQKIV